MLNEVGVKLVFDDSELVKKLGNLEQSIDGISNKTEAAQSSFSSMNEVAKGFIIAEVLLAAITKTIDLGLSAIEAAKNYESLRASFKNAFGGLEQADEQLKIIKDFAATTPFQFEELAESFLKFKNRGFTPTVEELTKLGDLASALGKPFDQLAEAILDAQTGEFERLKEFGISSKTIGDNIVLAFRGIEKQIAKTDEEGIRKAIISFGALEGITGSLAAQSQTLAGVQSNLQDNFASLSRSLGDKVTPQLKEAGLATSEFVQSLIDTLEPSEAVDRQFRKAIDSVITTQNELPKLVARYDELKTQKTLNKKEQAELNAAIDRVIQIAPTAAGEIDKYGKALSLSKEEIQAFSKAQLEQLRTSAQIKLALAQQTQKKLEGLNQLTVEQAKEFAKIESENSKKTIFKRDVNEEQAFKNILTRVAETQAQRDKANQSAIEAQRILNQLDGSINITKETKATEENTAAKKANNEETEKARKAREKLDNDLAKDLEKLKKDVDKSNIDELSKNSIERLNLEKQTILAGIEERRKELEEKAKLAKKSIDVDKEFAQLRELVELEYQAKIRNALRKEAGIDESLKPIELRFSKLQDVIKARDKVLELLEKTKGDVVPQDLRDSLKEATKDFEKLKEALNTGDLTEFLEKFGDNLETVPDKLKKALEGINLTPALKKGIQDPLEEAKKAIQDFLGIDDKEFNALTKAFGELGNSILDFLDAKTQAELKENDKLIKKLDKDLEKKQDIIDKEKEQKEKGFSNDLETAQQQYDLVYKQREEAIAKTQAIKEAAVKREIALNAIEQTSNLITAGAEIYKNFSKIPYVGIILGIAAVASMIASFSAFKQRAKAEANTTELRDGGNINVSNKRGGGGRLVGKTHEQGGIDIGHGYEAEHNEMVVNAVSSVKNQPFLDRLNSHEFDSIDLSRTIDNISLKSEKISNASSENHLVTNFSANLLALDKAFGKHIERQTQKIIAADAKKGMIAANENGIVIVKSTDMGRNIERIKF